LLQQNLLDSETILHALRMNLENLIDTTRNTIFRLLKLLVDLSSRHNFWWLVVSHRRI